MCQSTRRCKRSGKRSCFGMGGPGRLATWPRFQPGLPKVNGRLAAINKNRKMYLLSYFSVSALSGMRCPNTAVKHQNLLNFASHKSLHRKEDKTLPVGSERRWNSVLHGAGRRACQGSPSCHSGSCCTTALLPQCSLHKVTRSLSEGCPLTNLAD